MKFGKREVREAAGAAAHGERSEAAAYTQGAPSPPAGGACDAGRGSGRSARGAGSPARSGDGCRRCDSGGGESGSRREAMETAENGVVQRVERVVDEREKRPGSGAGSAIAAAAGWDKAAAGCRERRAAACLTKCKQRP